jgi:prefoldin subunit 5
MADDINRLAEKYIQEMKRAATEAQKGLERTAQEMDRLGRMMYEDVRKGVQDPGSTLNNVKDRMIDDLDRELPSMMDDMKRLERRMERYMQEMQDEFRKFAKK